MNKYGLRLKDFKFPFYGFIDPLIRAPDLGCERKPEKYLGDVILATYNQLLLAGAIIVTSGLYSLINPLSN